mmetsp:Transcript_62360/g.115750  ORF Transcript_62360/g.115750 Transcript_62360/m.115750 type:complete len:458 (+) Transcript_62360:56-1429(+)
MVVGLYILRTRHLGLTPVGFHAGSVGAKVSMLSRGDLTTWQPAKKRVVGGALILGIILVVVKMMKTSMPPDGGKAIVQAALSGSALFAGLLFYALGMFRAVRDFLIYFGAQTGMNLYMKSVLSAMVLDEQAGLVGLPIGFLMTIVQQIVALLTFSIFVGLSKLRTSGGYSIKKLITKEERQAVLLFSLTFALNIGLNNFSLSLLAISTHTTIRACMPLATAAAQVFVGTQLKGARQNPSAQEWFFMTLGVICAVSAVIVLSGGALEARQGMWVGVPCAVGATLMGAVNMVLASFLGKSFQLNPLDKVIYMTVPASVLLLAPAMLVKHPVPKWPGYPAMTDLEVIWEVIRINPWALRPVFFSGVLSLCYNVVSYRLADRLSATHTTFAGSFNGAATVALSLILGLEVLPAGRRGSLYLIAVVGNILAFCLYSRAKLMEAIGPEKRSSVSKNSSGSLVQ